MTEKLVLLPEGDVWDRPCARVVGTPPGISDLVKVDGRTVVLKTPRRRGQRAQFEVWTVTDPDFVYDPAQQQAVMAERSLVFDKSS